MSRTSERTPSEQETGPEHELWLSRAREQEAAARLAELRRRLATAEQRNAAILPLRERIRALEEELGKRADELRHLAAAQEHIVNSLSWRITAPLRAGKRLIRRRSTRG
jgi:hypothetical protein